MRTTQTVKTIKRTSGPGSSGINSGTRTLTTTRTQVISGPNATGTQPGLRRSSRGSRVWKKTILGEKFEYSEKLREKKKLYFIRIRHGPRKKTDRRNRGNAQARATKRKSNRSQRNHR